ncbi:MULTISPECIES: DUF1826 domain-containing protein [unclassified Sphingomonas]|nr:MULTISPECIES: DUF1826 domain-containing protein [unclassified Sphingomonas]
MSWRYDANGNIRSQSNVYSLLGGNGAVSTVDGQQSPTFWYRYDTMNRVVTDRGMLSGGQIVRGTVGVDLSYDAAGQRRCAAFRPRGRGGPGPCPAGTRHWRRRRRFHADYVRARLITTYAGPGTQWLDALTARRLDAGIPPRRAEIRQLRTGQVGIFKGHDWPTTTPILHRSPPIARAGKARLLLVVDPAKPD